MEVYLGILLFVCTLILICLRLGCCNKDLDTATTRRMNPPITVTSSTFTSSSNYQPVNANNAMGSSYVVTSNVTSTSRPTTPMHGFQSTTSHHHSSTAHYPPADVHYPYSPNAPQPPFSRPQYQSPADVPPPSYNDVAAADAAAKRKAARQGSYNPNFARPPSNS